jgi:transcription elongation factor S-II
MSSEIAGTKTSSVIKKVNSIKASLSKELPCEDLSDESVERCHDLLKRLDEAPITLKVLTDTLVGTVVSKFKANEHVGPSAKALVKKWKKLAKDGQPATSPSQVGNSSSNKDIIKNEENAAMEAEWGDLPALRKSICTKLHDLLNLEKVPMLKNGMNKEAFQQLTLSRASEVEAAIETRLGNSRTNYTEKARSLCFNIKKNSKLRHNIIMGSTSGEELLGMTSEQLATAERTEARNAEINRLQESRRLDWETANEGKINDMCGIKGDLLSASLFTCSRCKSVKTTSTQKQTRSADEPMTVFVLCINCGKRWKC